MKHLSDQGLVEIKGKHILLEKPMATGTMAIFSAEATLHADFSRGIVEVRYIHPRNEETYRMDTVNSGHGGETQVCIATLSIP